MKKLLVRADDLGYSEGVNYGIAKTVIDGIVRSVGLMTNMPAAKHGLHLLDGATVCYGQHTNICVGTPLTDPKKIPSITTPSGQFKSSKEYRAATEDFVNLEEVVLEIEAQYKRFVELTGRQPEYFEGHAVMSPNFSQGLSIVAEHHKLKLCEIPFDGKPVIVGETIVYGHIASMDQNHDPFQDLQKTVKFAHEGACDVFICHPGYLDAYILKTSSLTIPRALEVEMLCDSKTKGWLAEQPIELVTYNDL